MDILAIDEAAANTDAVTGNRTGRRAAYSLGNPNGSRTDVAEACQRAEVHIPVTTTRWRLQIRNWRGGAGGGVSVAVPIAFTGVWVGKQAKGSTGVMTGNFTAAPAQALPAFTLPADGSRYTSPWVTDSANQFPAYDQWLISYGWVAPAGTAIQNSLATSQWMTTGAGKSAGAGDQTVAGISLSTLMNTSFFDAWIEYEFNGTQAVFFVAGDSRTAGYGGPTVPKANSKNWPNLFSLLTGCPVINAGISGVTSAALAAPASYGGLNKWGLGTDIFPDAAIIDYGTNDLGAGQQAASVEPYLVGIYDWCRSVGIKRVLGDTIPPWGGYTIYPKLLKVGTFTTAAAAGATSIVSDTAFAAGDSVVLDDLGSTREGITVAAGGSTGSGPYTIPLVSALVNAHPVGHELASAAESYRRGFNKWMRTVPAGLSGVVDIDKLLSNPATGQAHTLDPAIDSGDRLHYGSLGDVRIAAAMPTRFVTPIG